TAPLAVKFTDTTTNTPTRWVWNATNVTGNNTAFTFAITQSPLQTFGVGNYSINLNATNSGGFNLSTQITFINVSAPAPVASFTADKTNGTAPLAVQFTDTTTNTPTRWVWNATNVTGNNTAFTFATTQSPLQTFGVGNYLIILNATNCIGFNISTQVTFINVSAPAPVAGFTSDKTSGTAPLAVQFTDTTANTPTGWAWFFGDENWMVPAWTQANASAGWTARYGHSSVAMPDGSIVLMAGQTSSTNYVTDAWRSTDDGATWTRTTERLTRRSGHTSVAMPDGSIVNMGGQITSTNYMNDTLRSTNNGATWTQVNRSSGWTRRSGHTSVVMADGTIVLMGGQTSSTNYVNDTWRSTNNGAKWTQVNASPGWSARSGHTSVAMPDGSIVLMGGAAGASGQFNDTWRSTDNGATWTQVNASSGWSARSGHTSVAMLDGSIVLMGGEVADSSQFNDTWRSTDNGATWTQVNTSSGWAERAAHTSVAMPDGSVVLMGGNANNVNKNDTWQFRPTGSSEENPSHTYTTTGTYNVSLQAYNTVGYNSTRKPLYITVTGLPAPTITVISPDSGPLAAGTLVNITGTNLAGATSVTFGSAAATINTNTATTINMTAPAASAGAGPVTVTVTTPGGTATTSYTYTGDPIPGVIGFRWNTSDPSPRLYQIDSDGTVIPNATGDWFNTHLPWSGMKTVVVNASNSTPVLYGTNNRGDGLDLSGTYGDVMVEIPRFYTCSTYANGNFSYWISPGAQDALHYTVAPMFNQRGTGTDAGTPATYYYVGRYDATLVGTKLQSATGKVPAVSMTIGTARTYAENKGAGWGITNVWTVSGLRQLFYTEMVTLNSQAAWTGSRGWVEGNTGPTISGNESIDTAIYAINATGNGTGLYGKTSVSYRGIENLWGNVYQFQDGLNAIKTNTNVINATGLGVTGQKITFKDVLDANDVQSVGALALTDGYQTNLLNTDVARPLFLPSNATGGSDTTYLSDFFSYPRSTNFGAPNILISGGDWDDAGRAGVMELLASSDTLTSGASVGARLEFRRSPAPMASFSATNTSVAINSSSQGWAGVAPFTMVFNDTSTNYPAGWAWGRNNLTVTAWEQFSTINNATQTFVAGNWSVNLTVINSGGAGISGITWVNVSESTPAPVANFTGTPTSGTAPLTVTFTDTSTNTPTSWSWAFGDSNLTNATVQNPVHTYSAAGTYTVSLNATNAGGSNVSVRTGYITVRVPAPVPDFSANITSGPVPLLVSFTDLSTQTPTGWAWFFGDENYTQAWTQQTASAEWSQREGHTGVTMPDGSIVIMGGLEGGGFTNDTWRSTDKGVTWTQLTASAGWSERQWHSSVVTPDGNIVLTGGEATDGMKDDVWQSADNGVTWTQVTASAGWSAREFHSTVVLPDGSIVLTGGWDCSLMNDTWRSTDNGATWTLVNASSGWSARQSHTSVVLPDGSIVLSGGEDINGYTNDTWQSIDKGATWTQVSANAGWLARARHSSVVMPDGNIVLLGGEDRNNRKNDVWQSTDNGTTWTQVTASAGWSARQGQKCVVLPDGSVVLIAGYDGGLTNDVWRFQPVGSSIQNPSHVYALQGNYSIALQAYNTGGYNSTRKAGYITVGSPAPVAGFTATPVTGTVPLTVKFTDSSTNTPTIWNWSFGDSNLTNATVQNPVHTYSAAGTYTVSLNATNAGGSNISVQTTSVTVYVPAPVPAFSANITSGSAPLPVAFTDASTQSPTGRVWFFGDEPYTQPWTLVNANAAWSARSSHSSVTLRDGSIILMGGDADGVKNDTWRSTDNGVTWTQQTANAGWAARESHTSVAMPDGSIVLAGGFAAVDGSLNDTWRSTDRGITWSLVNASSGWTKRYTHTSVVMPDGSILIMGGFHSGIYYSD
ncbi:MAG: kelch repeat-containing protein, partial [Methanoregula sp.]